ncbi:MAG TPA: DUF2911 domain-containing protein [Acidobacteriota bacterium]|nr:DUF2911 domain-containing protein [Acidobacteriota bacterium]
MRPIVIAGFFLVLLPVRAQQQRPAMVAEDGALQERGSARVLYWDTKGNTAFGQFAIDYGRPVWRKEYDDPANFDKLTKGKTYRLGSNYWTSLDTHVPLRVSGKDVAPGQYYLGLARSADGDKWSLVFVDAAKTRSMRIDAFQIARAPVLFQVPMTVEPAKGTSDKLLITLSYAKETPKDVTLQISWGKLQLAAPVQVTVGP